MIAVRVLATFLFLLAIYFGTKGKNSEAWLLIAIGFLLNIIIWLS